VARLKPCPSLIGMLLLVTDTSGKNGFVGLVRAEPGELSGRCEVIEEVPLTGGTFSAQLVPQISGLLAKHGFAKTDVDGFVVVSGPGSFTGLRVGLAAIKALAEVLHKPIVPVSLLEVVALAAGHRGRVLAAVDAGRGEIYAGEYDVAQSARMVREDLLSKDELASDARKLPVVTPDSSLAGTLRGLGIEVLQVDPPAADTIARLGRQKLESGQTVTPEALEANYIRRSDAEIFAKGNG